MNFNMFNPAIATHYENLDAAIDHLARLINEGCSMNDTRLLQAVLRDHDLLNDGFSIDIQDMIAQAQRRAR